MAGIKPNEFPAIIGALDGTEEIYSQAGGINKKYTVQQVWDGVTSSGQTLSQTLSYGNETDGEDIIMSNNDVIKALNGGGQLSLRAGADNVVNLTNDNDAQSKGIVYFDNTGSIFGFNISTVSATNNSIKLNYPSGFSFFSTIHVGLVNTTDFNSTLGNLFLIENTALNLSKHCQVNRALLLNTGTLVSPTIYNSGITHSIGLGGKGLYIKTSYTPYINQLSFQQDGNTFDLMIAPPATTADRLQTLADEDGVIMIQKYRATDSGTSALDGEVIAITTGGGDANVNLPDATIPNRRVIVKKVDAGAGKVNVKGILGQTIDGAAQQQLSAQWQYITVLSTGSSWIVIG